MLNKIRLYEDIPELIKPELERFFELIDHIVPDWCSHVWVAWQSGDSGDQSTVADITVFYDYRWARMNVYSSWLDQTEEFKNEALVHELMHLFVAPLSDYARDTLKLLIPEDEAEKFSKSTQQQIRERNESVTQDLTRMMLGRLVMNTAPDDRESTPKT